MIIQRWIFDSNSKQRNKKHEKDNRWITCHFQKRNISARWKITTRVGKLKITF